MSQDINITRPRRMPLGIIGIVLLIVVLQACSTSNVVVLDENPIIEAPIEDIVSIIGYDPTEYLIRSESVFYSVENAIPDVFQSDVMTSQASANSGFRIQIISTQDVRLVEGMRVEFDNWIDEEVPEYNANSYILFRQPFYRLHVGDFRSRNEAIAFAQVVKRKYPDAWIVFDTIDPNSLTIRIQN
jgi:hypothetical protein